MIAALAIVLQLAAVGPAQDADSLPRVTLEEALRRAVQLDPDYVSALGRVGDAEWNRRAARLAFVLPSINASTSVTKFSTEFFNVGTGALATQIVDARLEGSYDVFRGLSKLSDLRGANAELDRAHADAVDTRFQTALLTESDYYDVVAQRELTRVAEERVRRAEEQLAVARARVLSGAAVQTDSLQLLLELTRAQVELLQQRAALKVARFQLGRRIGMAGQVDAVSLDTLSAPPLPMREEEAAVEAVQGSPRVVTARAQERVADARVGSARGAYWPQVEVFGQIQSFDEAFFPTATVRSLGGLRVSVPIWTEGQREVALSEAESVRDAARATRRDEELGVRRDVVEAYQAYNTARASTDLAARAVVVARENLRVQAERYRAGATTIIDLITAQVDMAEADAGLVQARQATRLALAGLEAILGRRIFAQRGIGE